MIDKAILQNIARLEAGLAEIQHNIQPKNIDCVLPHNINPPVSNNMTIDEALTFLKKEIKEEMAEWEDRERYGKIGICHDAMEHLGAVEKFFAEISDDDWTCTHRLGDIDNWG